MKTSDVCFLVNNYRAFGQKFSLDVAASSTRNSLILIYAFTRLNDPKFGKAPFTMIRIVCSRLPSRTFRASLSGGKEEDGNTNHQCQFSVQAPKVISGSSDECMPIVNLVSDDVSSIIGMRVSTVQYVHLKRRLLWCQGRAQVCQHALSARNRPIALAPLFHIRNVTIFVNCFVLCSR